MSGRETVAVGIEISGFATRSLVLKSRVLGLEATIETAPILLTVIDKELAMTEISYLTSRATDT